MQRFRVHSDAQAVSRRGAQGGIDAHREAPSVYVELHDTGLHLARDFADRVFGDEPVEDPRERLLVEARRRAERAGGALFVDSTPGLGTQRVLVFDAADR